MRHLTALLFTILAVSAFATTPNISPDRAVTLADIASAEATEAEWIAHLRTENYPETALQIATAEATELRTWPGSERNYQKAYADWFQAMGRLDADILARDFRAYRWHVVQLALRRRVDWSDAAHLVRLSFHARP